MDEDGFFLADQRITIVGLGLMGGSLGLALRGRVKSLQACDPNPAVLTLARQMGFLDRVLPDLQRLLPSTDLLILAAPVRANLKLLAELPDLHPGSLAVLDLSSTKTEIIAAMERLPERFAALGGHPMCGKETAGLAYAEPHLFREAAFALVDTRRTTPALRTLAEELVAALTARPLWLDAETHDRWTAATSHLPYLLSVALAQATPPDAAPLAGSGFRSTARLAGSNVTMMLDILLTNPQPILAALDQLRTNLAAIEAALQNGDEASLLDLLEAARNRRSQIIKGNPPDELSR